LDDKITAAQERIDKNASDLRLRYMKIMTQLNATISSRSTFIMGSSS
jgi:hypothetical protein